VTTEVNTEGKDLGCDAVCFVVWLSKFRTKLLQAEGTRLLRNVCIHLPCFALSLSWGA